MRWRAQKAVLEARRAVAGGDAAGGNAAGGAEGGGARAAAAADAPLRAALTGILQLCDAAVEARLAPSPPPAGLALSRGDAESPAAGSAPCESRRRSTD